MEPYRAQPCRRQREEGLFVAGERDRRLVAVERFGLRDLRLEAESDIFQLVALRSVQQHIGVAVLIQADGQPVVAGDDTVRVAERKAGQRGTDPLRQQQHALEVFPLRGVVEEGVVLLQIIDPEIAVVVMVENGGHGNYTAEVVRDVMGEYFGMNTQDVQEDMSAINYNQSFR